MTDSRPEEADEREPPAEGDDLESYPDWWRRNAEEFRRYDLLPYRPPRFADDEIVQPVVDALEAELDAEIRLRVVDPQAGNRWEVLVDGHVVAALDRDRHVDGYSLFHVTSDEFVRLVRER